MLAMFDKSTLHSLVLMALGLYSSATFIATAPTDRQMFVTYFIFKVIEKHPAPGDMEMFELQQEGI